MGYCNGAAVATSQSSCQANGGQWLADPSTGGGSSSSNSMTPSQWMSGIGNMLGPLAQFGTNMYAISQQQPTQPYMVPGSNTTGNYAQQGMQTPQPPNGNSSMVLWIVLAVVAVILVAAGIYIAANKAKTAK